ncbi:MAG: aldo/keto reductase, partial [Pseudohongiellaceae bacterium]
QDLGICFLDTAPAYGSSEERLGKLLGKRQDWVIATKVGEEFENGQSRFDFSGQHTRFSIERSLRRLATDYLDIVLIHSDGNDEEIIHNSGCLEALQDCQQKGLVRAIGMSTKTIAGGLLAAQEMDLVMVTYNLEQQDKAVVEYAHAHNKGILVKKGLMSGHLRTSRKDPVLASLEFIFAEPGVSSVIVGSIDPIHMLHNVTMAKKALGIS